GNRRARRRKRPVVAASPYRARHRARCRGATAATRKGIYAERKGHRGGRPPRRALPMRTFNLPDLGEGLSEAEIVTWHVSPGDHVVVDQPLVSVVTEHAH